MVARKSICHNWQIPTGDLTAVHRHFSLSYRSAEPHVVAEAVLAQVDSMMGGGQRSQTKASVHDMWHVGPALVLRHLTHSEYLCDPHSTGTMSDEGQGPRASARRRAFLPSHQDRVELPQEHGESRILRNPDSRGF